MNPLKISLIISLLGIFVLLLLANFLHPEPMPISEISIDSIGMAVQVEGAIVSVKSMENKSFQIISINDSRGKIDITIGSVTGLKKGDRIEVIGKVTEYKKNLEIQADKIVLIK